MKRITKPADTSIIVSLFNFGESVDSLYVSLEQVFTRALGQNYEMVFVDDGSTDDTYERLANMARRDPRIRVLRMRSTFGEASTLAAGLRYSRGERIVFLSGRVRISPEEIPAFLEKLDQGSDMVVGWRSPRRDSFLNQGVSRIFNRMVSRVSRMRLHDINSGIIVTTRAVFESIHFYGDLYNFIPVLAAQQGYRVAEQKIRQLPGSFRTSRYPREYLQRLLDIVTVFFLTRYSKKPIHFLGFVGLVFAIAGMGIEIYLFIYRILRIGGIAGRPLLILGALFLVIGIQMISIGLLGEMLIFTHAGDLEEYNIQEIINE